jgi:hypothetical protein
MVTLVSRESNCALSPERNRQAKSTGRAERTRHGIGSAAAPGVELIGRLDPGQKPGEVKDDAVGRGLSAGIFVQPACLLLRNSHSGDFFEECLGLRLVHLPTE